MLHVLPGGADVGEALVVEPAVRVIAFTGSTRAGRAVGALAGQHLKRVHLELGGNSALIVLDDVDLEAAASVGAWGSFAHQGQICMATGRHLVHASIADEYVGGARRAGRRSCRSATRSASRSRSARSSTPGSATGSTAWSPRRVDAGRDGCAAGGTYEGLFYRPTVLADVPLDAPGLPGGDLRPGRAGRRRSPSLDEVVDAGRRHRVRAVAGHPHPRRRCAGLELAERIPTGLVHINDQTVNDEAVAPFGGVGASGTGSRHGGAQANIEAFTETQWVTMRGDLPAYPF